MSLTKFLMAPINLFKKDVITFLIIRRYDLDVDDKLRYIAVKPTASITTLRQKVWYLLDLPDYCEEIIILKSNDVEIPLTELRKGNDPQNPYVLEVWLPGKRLQSSSTMHNMLTMGQDGVILGNISSDTVCEEKSLNSDDHCISNDVNCNVTMSNETIALNKLHVINNERAVKNLLKSEYNKSELSCRISSSSLLFKLQGRKSKDNFASILLKIQNDLSNLSNKLSNLENRIPT